MNRVVTAVPAGHRYGQPLKRRTFTIDRDPEPFTPGTSRIFAENRSHRHPDGRFMFTPVVVLTDSLEASEPECPETTDGQHVIDWIGVPAQVWVGQPERGYDQHRRGICRACDVQFVEVDR